MNYFAQTYTTTTTHASGKTLLLFGLAFVIFIAVFIALYARRREITFTGVVEDKNINENQVQNNNMMMNNRPGITIGNNGGVTHSYMIKVKTDAGKTVNYQISEGKYEIIKIGDRVSKAKGTTDVEIVSSTSPAAPANPGVPPPASPMPPTTPVPPTPPVPPVPTNPQTPQTFA